MDIIEQYKEGKCSCTVLRYDRPVMDWNDAEQFCRQALSGTPPGRYRGCGKDAGAEQRRQDRAAAGAWNGC